MSTHIGSILPGIMADVEAAQAEQKLERACTHFGDLMNRCTDIVSSGGNVTEEELMRLTNASIHLQQQMHTANAADHVQTVAKLEAATEHTVSLIMSEAI